MVGGEFRLIGRQTGMMETTVDLLDNAVHVSGFVVELFTGEFGGGSDGTTAGLMAAVLLMGLDGERTCQDSMGRGEFSLPDSLV